MRNDSYRSSSTLMHGILIDAPSLSLSRFKWRTANETLEEESDFLVTVDDIGNNDTAQSTNIALNTRQTHWPSHMAVASMVPNVTMLLLNAAFGHRSKKELRLKALLFAKSLYCPPQVPYSAQAVRQSLLGDRAVPLHGRHGLY